jgi:hypothetical protein
MRTAPGPRRWYSPARTAATVTLLERLSKLCVDVAPRGYCFPCAARVLDVSQHELRDAAQLLVPPVGTHRVDARACTRCGDLTDVITAP